MLRKIKNGLHKRKVKLFLVFLLCSSFAWFMSKLSEPYISNTVFNIEYRNTPDSLLLADASKKNINVRLKASGFKFLGFNFNPKKVSINLSSVEKRRGRFFVSQSVYQDQIEGQLPNSMELMGIDRDTLFFKFHEVVSKKVPVVANIGITLAQNYLLDGRIVIQPDSVTITGPVNEIDTINTIHTEAKSLSDLTSNFSKTVKLENIEGLKNTKFSITKVKVSGVVFRFSERVIEVPVEVINLPIGMKIKTFPNNVSILCRANIDKLKDLTPTDFKLIADYNLLKDSSTTLLLNLIKRPEQLYSAAPMETQVEYILKRE